MQLILSSGVLRFFSHLLIPSDILLSRIIYPILNIYPLLEQPLPLAISLIEQWLELDHLLFGTTDDCYGHLCESMARSSRYEHGWTEAWIVGETNVVMRRPSRRRGEHGGFGRSSESYYFGAISSLDLS
jgi:hypothetical protein